MECPFETPIHKVQPDILLWEIRDCNGKLLLRTGIGNGELVDYIVQTINGHEKLIKIKQISYEAICTGDQEASDKAIGLIEDFEQVLKEAEKS